MADSVALKRLNYFQGQVLTAQDFIDQQDYHLQKLQLLLSRFPNGIVRGLEVTAGSGTEGGLEVTSGVAVDADGRLILVVGGMKVGIVKEGGSTTQDVESLSVGSDDGILRISTEYLPNIPDGESRYLNIERYEDPETGTHKGGCVDEERTYRILETAVFTWTTNPNPPGKLSIAKISKVGDNLEVKGSASEDFRTNAGIMTESLVIFQDDEEGHNHTGGDKGRKIPIEGLEDDVKTPSVTSSGHLEGTLPDFTLRDLVVNTAQLVDKAVTSNKLADGSVATDQLVDLAVTSNKLSDGAVDTTKSADGAVDTAKLANGAVDTDKLANAAVQPANLNLVQGATSSTKTANTTGVAVPLSAYTQTSIVNVYPMSEGEVSWSIKRSATGWEVVVKATGDTTTHPTVDFTVTHFHLG